MNKLKPEYFPSGWYAFIHISEIPKNKPLGVTRFNLPLVIWKNAENIVVMDDICPHRSAKLSIGKICNNKIHCPFHGFEFSSNGECSFAPEFGKAIPKLAVKTYKTKVIIDMVWIMLSDSEIEFEIKLLENIYKKYNGRYTFFKKKWDINITRCIENQLDYTHLPVVHKTTIGRNFSIPVKPMFIQKDNSILTYANEQPESLLSSFIFPNSWVLNVSDKMKVVAYFVPIDVNETIIYIFSWRSFLNYTPLKQVINFIMNLTNKIILKQDRKVVESQKNDILSLNNEMLMKHDKAIRIFRNMWQSNLSKNSKNYI